MITTQNIDSSGGTAYISARFPPLLKWTFLLFIGSIPVEVLGVGLETENFSLSKAFGMILLVVSLGYRDIAFRRMPRTAVWFGLYIIVSGLMLIRPDAPTDSTGIMFLVSYIQLLILHIIAYNIILAMGTGLNVVVAYIAGALILAGVTVSQYGLMNIAGASERLDVLGLDENNAASILGIAIVGVVGLALIRKAIPLLVSIPLILTLGVVMAATGSRGGVLTCVTGLAVLLLPRSRRMTMFRRAFMVASLCVIGWVLWSSSSILQRRVDVMMYSDYEARFGLRDVLMRESARMIAEKPVLGWGIGAGVSELGRRMGRPPIDTHNTLTWVLLDTGLLGGVPFLIALFLGVRTAWRVRYSRESTLPIALLVSVMTATMTVNWINRKHIWLFVAYAVACEMSFRFNRSRVDSISSVTPAIETSP